MSMESNSFVNKALANFAKDKTAKIVNTPGLIKQDSSDSSKKESGKEEAESTYLNPYEEYIKTWEQGDPIPLIPPGKTLQLCKVGFGNVSDVDHYQTSLEWRDRKAPSFKSIDEIDLKTLGPKLKESMPTLLSRVAAGRGLWVDDKNKLRCPPGTPAANQFTDITGSNCFIISPETAAGSARRAVRRVAGRSAQMAGNEGQRFDTGGLGGGLVQYAEDGSAIANPDDVQALLHALPEGSRVRADIEHAITGAMRGGPRQARSWKDRAKPGGLGLPYHLSERERIERGKKVALDAKILHYRLTGKNRPRGGPKNMPLLRNPVTGQIIGDLADRDNFISVMRALFPNVDINEIEQAFDQALPGGLGYFEHQRAKKTITAFWESMVENGLLHPEACKWVTQLNITDSIGGDPTTAFAVSVNPFAPSILSGGRGAGVAATAYAKKANAAAQGGIHVTMEMNPRAMLAYATGRNRSFNQFWDGSGRLFSAEGKANYLGAHEFGHLLDFTTKLNALGYDTRGLSRYPSARTLTAGPGGRPVRAPNKEVGAWMIDLTRMQNPMNNPSIDELKQAVWNLQNNQYTGGRVGHRKIDLQNDLDKFHLAFLDAFMNNINVTDDDHKVMAMVSGGKYAYSSPIEARAEFYAVMRKFGDTPNNYSGGRIPGRLPTASPMKPGDRSMIDSFIDSHLESAYRQHFGLSSKDTVPRAPGSPNHGQWLAFEAAERPRIRQQLDSISTNVYTVNPSNWNVTGYMRAPNNDVFQDSLHANMVRNAVVRNEQQTNRRKNSPIKTAVTGYMAAKPSRPREPDNGPMTGSLIDYFRGCKNYKEFLDRYNKLDITYFDYETTGFGADGNMPVQVGAVKMRGGKVVDRFNMFMNPGIPLGEWAQKNLKDHTQQPLTDAYLAQQPSIKEAHEKLLEFMGPNAVLGGQYTPFDLEVFNRVLAQEGLSYTPSGVMDSKALADELLPKWTPENPDGPHQVASDGTKKASSALGPLADYLKVNLGSGWHTADADALASAEISQRIIERAADNPSTPKHILDVDSIPKMVEQRRRDYTDAMQRYEKDMAAYETSISGKMKSFTTENGSQYTLLPDGRLHRKKDPARGTTVGDSVGEESTFDNTVFLSRETANDVQVAAERGKHLNKNGKLVGMKHDDSSLDTKKFMALRREKRGTFDEDYVAAGGKIQEYEIPESAVSVTPQIGLHPFEWNNDGRLHHKGSAINSVETEPTPTSISGKMSAISRQIDKTNDEHKKAVVQRGGSFGTDIGTKYADKINNELRGSATLPVQTLQTRRPAYEQNLARRIDHLKNLVAGNNPSPIHPTDRFPSTKTPDEGMLNELSGLDPEFLKYVANSSSEQLTRDAKIAALEFHAGVDPRVRIQVPASQIKSTIDNGVMRNSSTGNTIRKKYEAWIGLPPDMPEHLRPVSGHVVHKDWLESELKHAGDVLTRSGRTDPDRYNPELSSVSNGVRGRVNTLGNVEVVLRPEVSKRTSYGYGDSVNDHIRPVAMTSDNSELIQQAIIHSGHDGVKSDETWNISPLEMLYGKWKKDFSAHRTRPGRNQDGSPISARNHAPMESLTLGGVNPEDIEHIKIDYNAIPKSFSTFSEDPLSDDSISAMRISSPEKLEAVNKLRESGYRPKNLDRLELFKAAEAFKKYCSDKNIGVTITNQSGLDVFNPRTHNIRAPKSADAEQAIRLNMQNEIKERIQEELVNIKNEQAKRVVTQ